MAACQRIGSPAASMSFTRRESTATALSHLNTGWEDLSARSLQLTPLNGVTRLTVAPASEADARILGVAALQPGVVFSVSLPPATLLPVRATVTTPPWMASVRQPVR